MTGYSIWIPIEGKHKKVLERIVAELAGNYGCPLFEPHLTLLGPIDEEKDEVIKKTKELATLHDPFELEIEKVDYSTTYFQCVFARIKTNQHLINFRMKAQEMFGIDKFFMPHISLFYGNVPTPTRAKIVRELDLPEIAFTAEKLIITPAVEDPDKWERLAEISL